MEIIVERRARLSLLQELVATWHYRELLRVLIRRDLTVRYKETVLGAAWAVLQPLALMTVFWVVLGRILRDATGGVPYPLFALAGLLPWTLFSSAVSSSTGSLLGASHLIQKVYFPRLIIPLSTLGVALIDFGVGFALLAAACLWHGLLTINVWTALLPLALILLAAITASTLCSALAAAYRDTRYMIPLVMQVWLFATPVIYPASLVGEDVRWILEINPMAPLIEAFRACVLGGDVDWGACALAGLFWAGALWLAARFFMSVERRLADTL